MHAVRKVFVDAFHARTIRNGKLFGRRRGMFFVSFALPVTGILGVPLVSMSSTRHTHTSIISRLLCLRRRLRRRNEIFAYFFMHGQTRIGVICASQVTSASVQSSFRCAIVKSFRKMSCAPITFLPVASGELFHPPFLFSTAMPSLPSMMQV